MLAVLLLALLPASAAANPTTSIIVKRDAGLSAAERADIRADADVRLVETLSVPNAEVVAAAPGDVRDALRDLNADPDVAYAELDRPISALSDDTYFDFLWGLENRADAFSDFPSIDEVFDADTDAPEAWADSTGDGETIAVVDSGVDVDHPDLVDQLAAGWDYVDHDGTPEDQHSHGTHVTGTIAATNDNDEGVVGVAPDAQITPLRVLDENGSGFVSDAVSAYNDAGADGTRIVNASLGGEDFVQIEHDAIALNSNVLFVVAAGNSGNNNDKPAVAEYPCAYDLANVLCVGASRPDDAPADFSNYGATTVDLFAPGYGILSTIPDDDYGWKDGTSMATPHVAGAAALVMDVAPTLTPTEVKAVLLQSADYNDALGGRSVSGRRLNAAAAVQLALTNGGPSPDGDGDSVRDGLDACPATPSSQMANGCPDLDRDGVTDGLDNCPSVANDQTDSDGDGVGDACEPPTGGGTVTPPTPTPTPPADRDADGVYDVSDACPTVPAATANGCPLAQVTSASAKARKRTATITVNTSQEATVRITVERKRGRRWVRVARKTIVTSGGRARLKISRLKPGAHRARISVSTSSGSGTPVTKTFRVR